MKKLGMVPYINALPLWKYLTHPVHLAHPSELKRLILNRALDYALLPVLAYLNNPELEIIPEAGVISSNGPVQSVGIYYDPKLNSPRDIESLKLTPDSVTSVGLTKVILTQKWNRDWQELTINPSYQPQAYLEIGDKALFFEQKSEFKFCDLGEEWTQWTQLPFVYAVWVKRKGVSTEMESDLIRSKQQGLDKIEEIISEIHDYPRNVVHPYLTKSIQYEMTPQALKGLELFREKAFKGGLISSI